MKQYIQQAILNQYFSRNTHGNLLLSVMFSLIIAVSFPLAELTHEHTDHGECDTCFVLNKLTDVITADNHVLPRFQQPSLQQSIDTDPAALFVDVIPPIIRGPPSLFD